MISNSVIDKNFYHLQTRYQFDILLLWNRSQLFEKIWAWIPVLHQFDQQVQVKVALGRPLISPAPVQPSHELKVASGRPPITTAVPTRTSIESVATNTSRGTVSRTWNIQRYSRPKPPRTSRKIYSHEAPGYDHTVVPETPQDPEKLQIPSSPRH